MRSMVEGLRRSAPLRHQCHNPFKIVQHISGAETERSIALTGQPFVARLVPGRTAGAVVGFTVYLDCQTGLEAEEVEHERPCGMLTPESEASRPLA